LPQLDEATQEEIGWGDGFDRERFNRFIDGFRTMYYLRRGLSVSGYDNIEALHARELSDVMTYEEFASLSDVKAAVALYRAREARASR